jgi:hypothetical protein
MDFIRDKYQNGDVIKIWYSGEKSLIDTSLEISRQNKTTKFQNKINLLKTVFKHNFPHGQPIRNESAIAPEAAQANVAAPLFRNESATAQAPPQSLEEWCSRYDVNFDKFMALFKKYPTWPNLYKLENTNHLVKKWIIEFLGDDAERVIKIIEGKKAVTKPQFDILYRLYELTLSHLRRV